MIKSVFDASFKKYGKVLKNYDLAELTEKMLLTPEPDDVVYVPGDANLEKTPFAKQMQDSCYGGLPVQVGYCNGHNKTLNAVEYHRSSEINVAIGNDLILLIGCEADIEDDYTYDTANIEAYLLPAGTAIEVYATTLHYAPCGVDGNGFRCVVVLPKDTNTDLTESVAINNEDPLLFAKNKWLIGHKDAGLPANAFIGLKGKNVTTDDFK